MKNAANMGRTEKNLRNSLHALNVMMNIMQLTDENDKMYEALKTRRE